MDSLLRIVSRVVFVVSLSFESWFDISTITSDTENIVAIEREQNVLHMLHQVSVVYHLPVFKFNISIGNIFDLFIWF